MRYSDGVQWNSISSGTTAVYVKGTALNNSGGSQPATIKIGGNVVFRSNRGLTLVILDATSHAVISTTTYDTVGSTANSTALANAINAMTFNQIGILASYDNIVPSTTLPGDLTSALGNRGLTKIATASNLFRASYSSIFRGASNGPVIESLGPANSVNPTPVATVLVEDTFAT
ncbi:MAG: interleukin-like EMT inducer domain-containing protein [Pirellulales bacterium]